MTDWEKMATPYLTMQEAAEYLRLKSCKTLKTWADKGLVQYYSLAGQRLFSRDLLDKFVQTRLKKGRA